MSIPIFFTNETELKENTVLDLFESNSLSSPQKKFIFKNINQFFKEISLKNGELQLQCIIFTKYFAFNMFFDEEEVYKNEFIPKFLGNTFHSILYHVNKNKVTKEDYHLFLKKYGNIISFEDFIVWNDYISKNAVDMKLDFLELKNIHSKEQFIYQYPIYFRYFKMRKINGGVYIQFLKNYNQNISYIDHNFMIKSKSMDFVSISAAFRRIAFQSFFHDTNRKYLSNSLWKSIVFAKNIFDIVNSLNLLNVINIDIAPTRTNAVSKIMFRFMSQKCILKKLLVHDFQKTIAILLTIKKDTGYKLDIKNTKNNVVDEKLFYYYFTKYNETYKFKLQDSNNLTSIKDLYELITESNQKLKSNSDLAMINTLILHYLNILSKTRFDPNQIIADLSLSMYLIHRIDELKSVKNIEWFFDPMINNFQDIVNFSNIIHSENSITKKSDDLLEFFNKETLNPFIYNTLLPRAFLFCIDNFNEMDQEIIEQLTSKVSAGNFLTLTVLISKLLDSLINHHRLSDQDIYYLNTYLGHELEDYTQEAIAELVASLLMLERQPQMPIQTDYGNTTGSVVQSVSTTEFGQSTSILPTTTLETIPEELVDLITDYQDLMYYVEFYFEYLVLRSEWREYDDINIPYQKIRNLQVVMSALEKYHHDMRLIKQEYPNMVDKIDLLMLEVEILLQKAPDVAFSVLNQLKSEFERFGIIHDELILPRYNEMVRQVIEKLHLNDDQVYQDMKVRS